MTPLGAAWPPEIAREMERAGEDGPSRRWSRPAPSGVPGSKAPRLEVLLQPRPLIVTGLPYKRDDSLREVKRTARTGAGSLLEVTYLATDSCYPLPFGADRGLLAWITTKAFADGTVRFGAIADYFRAFRLDPGGRSYRLFRERYHRVSNLALRIEEVSPDERKVRRLFLVPSASEPASLTKGSANDLKRQLLSYDRYGLELDPAFWQYLRETRIPTPLDLLRLFHDAPQGWDFAQLVLFRCYTARSVSVIPWEELLEQLGASRSHPRRLKASLAGVLHTVRSFHPQLPARFLPGLAGLEVGPGGCL